MDGWATKHSSVNIIELSICIDAGKHNKHCSLSIASQSLSGNICTSLYWSKRSRLAQNHITLPKDLVGTFTSVAVTAVTTTIVAILTTTFGVRVTFAAVRFAPHRLAATVVVAAAIGFAFIAQGGIELPIAVVVSACCKGQFFALFPVIPDTTIFLL